MQAFVLDGRLGCDQISEQIGLVHRCLAVRNGKHALETGTGVDRFARSAGRFDRRRYQSYRRKVIVVIDPVAPRPPPDRLHQYCVDEMQWLKDFGQ